MTTGAVRLVNAAPPMGGVAGGRLECVLQASLPEHGLAGPEEACDEPEQHVRPRWPIGDHRERRQDDRERQDGLGQRAGAVAPERPRRSTHFSGRHHSLERR